MAVKEFENFDYNFALKNKQEANQRLKYFSIAFVVVVLIFTGWAFISSLGIFNRRTESINQPIADPAKERTATEEAAQAQKQAYEDSNIPYDDPSGRFSIRFLTPYVSNQIVVTIFVKDRNQEIAVRNEATQIINRAKEKVDISNVYYINSQ